jgi:hypothetical protein
LVEPCLVLCRENCLLTSYAALDRHIHYNKTQVCRLRWKCDGTRAENRFRLSAKRTSPFKSAGGRGGGASIQSTTGSRVVCISGSNAGYTMFRSTLKGTGYPLHSPVSPSLPRPTSPCASTFQLDSSTIQCYEAPNQPSRTVSSFPVAADGSKISEFQYNLILTNYR